MKGSVQAPGGSPRSADRGPGWLARCFAQPPGISGFAPVSGLSSMGGTGGPGRARPKALGLALRTLGLATCRTARAESADTP